MVWEWCVCLGDWWCVCVCGRGCFVCQGNSTWGVEGFQATQAFWRENKEQVGMCVCHFCLLSFLVYLSFLLLSDLPLLCAREVVSLEPLPGCQKSGWPFPSHYHLNIFIQYGDSGAVISTEMPCSYIHHTIALCGFIRRLHQAAIKWINVFYLHAVFTLLFRNQLCELLLFRQSQRICFNIDSLQFIAGVP